VIEFAAEMRRLYGLDVQIVSPGGGMGIAYVDGMTEMDIAEWMGAAADALERACALARIPHPSLVFEPGRWIAGPAGVALYRVGSRRDIDGVRRYVSVDGGMADNIRPALYDAVYTAELANRTGGDERETVTIAGKYCESGDVLIRDIELPRLNPEDLLAVPAAGAYCIPMASNTISRSSLLWCSSRRERRQRSDDGRPMTICWRSISCQTGTDDRLASDLHAQAIDSSVLIPL